MNELFVTGEMLADIGHFLDLYRGTNADAVTYAYPNELYLNIQIKDDEIIMKIYK